MSIIRVRDNKNNRGKRKEKIKDRKKKRGGGSYSDCVWAKWFCYASKLGFVQLIKVL